MHNRNVCGLNPKVSSYLINAVIKSDKKHAHGCMEAKRKLKKAVHYESYEMFSHNKYTI